MTRVAQHTWGEARSELRTERPAERSEPRVSRLGRRRRQLERPVLEARPGKTRGIPRDPARKDRQDQRPGDRDPRRAEENQAGDDPDGMPGRGARTARWE